MQNRFKMMKSTSGITLIALIITIIVLLILAGVGISMLTGENGILKKATTAKAQNEKANIKEHIELAVLTSRINTNLNASIDTTILENELIDTYKITDITKERENGKLPWIVKKDGYVFTINEKGEVTEKVGIAITTGDIEILSGSTEEKELRAQLLNGETGIIAWSSTGNITLSKTTGEAIRVTLNNAIAGDIATITAQIKGKDLKDTINVKVVAQATGLTIEPATVQVGKTTKIEKVTATPENAEEIINISYTSENQNIASVDSETREITGIAIGNTTITVTGKGKLSGNVVTVLIPVTVEKRTISITVEQIAANPKEYYGKEVVNYKTSDSDTEIYRIFYVDTEDYFREGKNTIYLKADPNNITHVSENSSYDTINTKVRTMNKLWAEKRGESESTWNSNEKASAYLCSPVNEDNYTTTSLPWKSFYKQNDSNVNYVIGSPSVEMYVKSYNHTHDSDSNGNKALDYEYQTSEKPGYIYKVYGEIYGTGFKTNANVLDDSSILYVILGKRWWLASPNIYGTSRMCGVENNAALGTILARLV